MTEGACAATQGFPLRRLVLDRQGHYSPETVIAEKFQAVVALGVINGRMKDYYGLWALPKAVDLDSDDLQASIEKTFERRQTEVPHERPPGLSQAFATDATKAAQWRAYSEATEIEGTSLGEVVDEIWTTLEPNCARAGAGKKKYPTSDCFPGTCLDPRLGQHTRIFQLLPVRQVLERLEVEGDQELIRRHIGIGRPTPGRAWPRPYQTLGMQPANQVAADLLAEDVLQPVSCDWLVIGDGGKHCDIVFAQVGDHEYPFCVRERAASPPGLSAEEGFYQTISSEIDSISAHFGCEPDTAVIDLLRAQREWDGDLDKLQIEESEEPDHLKQAGWLCHWLRKKRPIKRLEIRDESKLKKYYEEYYNETTAFLIGLKLAIFHECCEQGKSDEQIVEALQTVRYSDILHDVSVFLSHKAVSPHAIYMIHKSLLHPSPLG